MNAAWGVEKPCRYVRECLLRAVAMGKMEATKANIFITDFRKIYPAVGKERWWGETVPAWRGGEAWGWYGAQPHRSGCGFELHSVLILLSGSLVSSSCVIMIIPRSRDDTGSHMRSVWNTMCTVITDTTIVIIFPKGDWSKLSKSQRGKWKP